MKKIMFVGESKTGKSSYISYLLKQGHYESQNYPTVGVEAGVQTFEFERGEYAIVQLWDTAGKHSFHEQICLKFYEGMDAFIILIDMSNENTMKSIAYWTEKIKSTRGSSHGYQIGVIANKSDLAHEFEKKDVKQMHKNIEYYRQISLKEPYSEKCQARIALEEFIREKLYRDNLPVLEFKPEQNKETTCNCMIM